MSYRGFDRGGRGRGGGGPPPGAGRGRGFPDRGGRGGFHGGGRGGGPREQGGIFTTGQPARIDPRLTDKSEQDLVSQFSQIKLKADEIPLRPDFGTKGKEVILRANHFPVKFPPKATWFEYNVEISPKMNTAMRRVKRRIFQLAEETGDWSQNRLKGNVAHDHSSKLIACMKLPQPLRINVPYYDEDEDGPKANSKVYTLVFEFVRDVDVGSIMNYLQGDRQYRTFDIGPLTALFNILLAAHPTRSDGNAVMVGRNRFFFPSDSAIPDDLGGGVEAWRGFYSSARPAHNQLMVNVNVATTAFHKPGNLAHIMSEFRNANPSGNMKAFVKGLRVKTLHLGYKKTIKTLVNLNARQHSFDTSEYGKVTVEQYFQKKYKRKLQHPELSLVDVGGQKTNFLPPEVCEIIAGQPYKGKLTEDHTAAMIKIAANPPNVNARTIVSRGLADLGFGSDSGPLRSFGVSIGSEMTVVPGRILPRPRIDYKQGTPTVDERASWNLKDVKFAVGGSLSKWGVLLINDNGRDEFGGTKDPELIKTIQGFIGMLKKCGVAVDGQPMMVVEAKLPRKQPNDPIRAAAYTEIRKTLTSTRAKPNFLMVLLSNSDKHIYSGIKHLCDNALGVPTVCVQVGKLRKEKGQPQYFANVALKFNMKLGGVNHTLDPNSASMLQQKPTMLVGIDVTHPGPGSVRETPSIAAVVASVDKNFGQFPASMEMQKSRQEMVANLGPMMKERLVTFQARNKGVLPLRVLVYRDGVSEGQFQTVVDEELPRIKAAFKAFDRPQAAYRPELTIVICGKRHHTRFYPTDQEGADHNGNPKAGTVVDRGVTSIYHFDFFLQAHGGLQGTTKPTHYYVVHDEIGFKADQLQGLTNSVSYLFARATKAVSLVSPAYYADLACERGRCYLHKLLQGIGSDVISSASSSNEEAAAAVRREAETLWGGGVNENLKRTMFYL